MNADLIPFTYEGRQVRSVQIDGEPWFLAADVVDILEIGRVHDALRGLDDDEKGADTIRTPGGYQQVSIVNEPGLYSLILRSRKPEAKAFKRWVTHEVIPAIRKTGRYEVQHAELPVFDLTNLDSVDQLVRAASAAVSLARQERSLRLVAETKVAQLEPAANAWTVLASADGDYAVADAAKVLSRDPSIKLGRDRLFTVLAEAGWIHRQRGDSRWRVYQTAVDTGRLSELPSSHYHPRTGLLVLDPPQVRVTVKGLQELHHRLGGVSPLRLSLGPLSTPGGAA